jgi:hypothetical protein
VAKIKHRPVRRDGGQTGIAIAATAEARATVTLFRSVAELIDSFSMSQSSWLYRDAEAELMSLKTPPPLRAGAADVGMFFGIYSRSEPVRLAPAWLDGREVIAVWEDLVSPKRTCPRRCRSS